MREHVPTALMALTVLGCAPDDAAPKSAHASCESLDDRGVVNRIDGMTSNRQDVFALDGHCLEATSVIPYGDVVGVRFSPVTSDDEVPFYIQMFFVPPSSKQTLVVYEPERLSNADCVDIEAGFVCGHVNDVVNTPNIEVDLRGKGGTLTFNRVRSVGDGLRDYEGSLEWTVWGVDTTQTPDVYDEPAVLMTGDIYLEDL